MTPIDADRPTCCPRPHPDALPHGEIQEIFPDVFFVQGTVKMKGGAPVTLTFGRNMTIVRQNGDLVLFNTVRLNEEGLQELEKLGTVKHIVRLAMFHGSDDPFYKDRYQATAWAPKGAPYFPGFDLKAKPYMVADELFDSKTTRLPLAKSQAILIASAKFPEALFTVEAPEGKIMIAGDAFQNWNQSDPQASCVSRCVMWLMGFHKAHAVGPAWQQHAKPDKKELLTILGDTKFDHLLPSHGNPCLGQAYQKFEPAVQALPQY